MDTPTNFCCNCSHLLGKRHDPGNAEAWRCWHPANIASDNYNLVTGIKIRVYKCAGLSQLRCMPTLCGPTGAWYEQYIPPTYSAPPVPAVNLPHVTKAITPALKARLGALKAEDL